MPAIVANAKNFLLNSDYPTDKVIFQQSYSVAIGASSYNDVTVAHGLGFTPLLSAQWSTSSTMTPTYSIGGGPRTSGSLTYQTGISSDGTNIYISTTNTTASPVTLYFTVYGLMPSATNTDASFTSFSSDLFGFNTDYNYAKLYDASSFSVGTGTSTSTIAHNLGYVPQVAVWITKSGLTSPFIYNDVITSVPPFDQVNVFVDSTNLYVEFLDIIAARTIDYRIYLDD